MKPFDLQEALNGAPINAGGEKCYVLRNVTDLLDNPEETRYLVVFPSNHTDAELWTEDDFKDSSMWEEPELTPEQVLEKAYQENLPVNALGKGVFVIAKTKNGDYVIQEGRNIIYIADFRYKWEFYKEPAPKSDTITVTLPKPFKPKKGDNFWFISEEIGCNQYLKIDCVLDSNGDPSNYKDGNCFRSESDAQAWLDAMKNALEG